MNAFYLWTMHHESLFIALCICLCGLLGGGCYLGGMMPAVDLLLCAIGYPGTIFGFWGSVVWLYRRE